MISLKEKGLIRLLGMSGKTIEGARASFPGAGAIMVEYNVNDTSHEQVMNEARELGIGVVIKKGLAAGHLPAVDAIRFVMNQPSVTSLVVGGLNLEHFKQNIAALD